MAKFKKGDRVRALEDWLAVKAGKEYIVENTDEDGDAWVKVGENNYFMSDDELELIADEWTPKIGDRVRMAKEVSGRITDIPATIIQIRESGNQRILLKFDSKITWAHSGSHFGKNAGLNQGWFVDPSDLEPLPASKKLTIEAGKFYKTRDGRKVGPLKDYYGDGWIVIIGDGNAWNKDGTHREATKSDLIAEWVDEPIARVANDNATALSPTPKFKAGDKVKLVKAFFGLARVGATATVTKRETVSGTYGGKYLDIVWDRNELSGGQGDGGYNPDNFELVTPATTPIAIVALIENGQPKPSDRPFVHASEAAASTEAARLAGKHKGKSFGVFVLSQTVTEEKTYAHEWQRLAAKGEMIGAIKALRAANDLTLKGAKDAVEHWVAVAA